MSNEKHAPKKFTRRQMLAGAAAAGVALTVPGVASARPKPMRPPASASSVTIDVISDVQGDLADLGRALRDIESLGQPDALVLNGDLVSSGTVPEYEAFYKVFDSNPHPDRVFATFGNHEQLTSDPFEEQVDRWRDYTGMPGVYYKDRVRGVPILTIGNTEPFDTAGRRFVNLGEEQLLWLDETLDKLSRPKAPNGSPVLIFSHHILPDSVSGSTGPDAIDFYRNDFREAEELLTILGDHPNVIFFSAHSHWDLHREDWATRKVVPGGHPEGFTVVNGSFIQVMYGPDGDGGETPISGAEMQGSRITVDRRGNVEIEARDFLRDDVIQTLEVPSRTKRRR